MAKKKEIILLLDQLSEPLTTDEKPQSVSPERPGSRALETEGIESRAPGFQDHLASGTEGISASRLKQPADRKARQNTRNGVVRHSETNGEIDEDTIQADAHQSTEAPAPSEPALLRDLPFTLQGLSSTNFKFEPVSTLSLPPSLPLPIISLLHSLAEPSLLYGSLSQYVQSREEGLISQSLRAAIGIELRSYLGLIATLEGEIRRSIASLAEKDNVGSTTKVGVTLKRCVVWTREATMGLRLMSLMAEESKSKFKKLMKDRIGLIESR